MANYNANINLNVVGTSRLNAVLASVSKLNDLTQNLKPLNLLAPGGGNLGNKIRTAIKPITDFARDVENGNKRISNTFQGASQQAEVFRTVLQNVKVQAGGYEKQVASVKLYANALAEAEKQAVRLSRAQVDLLRTAKGLQTQNIRDAEVIGRRARVKQGREAQARTKEAASNAIIGGAFPLLFGQGAGAALGGGLGGAAGGLAGGQFGFGLSLVGTALGAAVDTFTQAAIDAGKSLNDPIANFQKLADAGLIASRSQQKYIEQLIEAGRVTEAATLIQEEIINKIGVEGLKDLQNAGAASDKLNKAFAEFSLQAQAAVAGPLAGLLSWLADVVAVGNRVNRQAAEQTDILQGLSEADRAALQREEQRILQGINMFNEAQKRQQVEQLYQGFASRSNVQRPGVSTDRTPALQALGETQELQKQVELEGKKLTLVGMSLEKNGQAYVEAAKAVALQEYENKLLEIKNSWIGKAFDIERNQAMIRLANLQYAGKLKTIDAERVKVGRDQLEIQKAILGLQAELIRTTLETADLDIQSAQITQGRAAALDKELNQLQTRLDLEARTLELRLQQQLLTKDLTAQERSLLKTIYKEQVKNLIQQYNNRQKIAMQAKAQRALDKALADADAMRQATQPFEDVRKQRELEVQYGKTYLRLVTEGILPAEAERIANFERLVSEQLNALDTQIAITQAALIQAEAYGVSADKIKELRDELDRLQKARGAAAEEAAKGPGEGAQPGDRIKEAVAAARGELNELLDLENQVIAAASAIGDAFQQAFTGLVSGAMTGQEALAAFFKGVGDHFMDMASMMIAKLIEIFILETVLGFITGGASGGGGGTPMDLSGTQTFNVPVSQMPSGMAFAEGGFVTGPTNALIGEAGEPEYVIPASKMRGAMNRYASGARGSAVIPSSGGEGGEQGGGTAVATPIDVRYTVERINTVDYVTADQFRAGMQQAAAQGARQGEQNTLRRMQNAPSTRRRLGI